MKIFLSGLPRFNERSLNDLKLFKKINNVENIYAAFWISDKASQEKVSIFKDKFRKAFVYEVPEKSFKSRNTFYWIDSENRLEKQYFLINYLLKKIPDQKGKFIRYRSDLAWEKIPQIKGDFNENIFLTTPFEGHEYVPSEPCILNDQFYIAEISLIRSIFGMIFKKNPKELRDIHLKQRKKLGLTQPLGSLKGIEGLLFELLSKNGGKINYCFGYYFIFYKPVQNLFKKLCVFEINLHPIFFLKKSPSRINLAFLLNFFFWFPKRIYMKIKKNKKSHQF